MNRAPVLYLLCVGLACGGSPTDSGPADAAATDASIPSIDSGARPDGGETADAASAFDADLADVSVDPDAGNGPNVMFVTSLEYSSNLGGLAGGDKICATVAASAGLKGKFVAWLSTSTTDAISRLGTARGWTRTDGRPFVDTVADLAAGHIFYPPLIGEFGSQVTDNWIRTMTGTLADGTRAADTCKDWTSVDPNDGGEVGFAATAGGTWTSYSLGVWPNNACSSEHLYCFQVDHQNAVAPTPVSSRLAFVSTTKVGVTGGLAAGDAACTKDATAAKLAGTYKAMMGTSTIIATSRFSLTGLPWSRVDGAQLWLKAKDLGIVDPLTAIDVRADGSVYTGDGWVGSGNALSVAGPWTCSDWTSTSPDDMALTGTSSFASWWLYGAATCDAGPKPVFCFQE